MIRGRNSINPHKNKAPERHLGESVRFPCVHVNDLEQESVFRHVLHVVVQLMLFKANSHPALHRPLLSVHKLCTWVTMTDNRTFQVEFYFFIKAGKAACFKCTVQLQLVLTRRPLIP